MLESILDVIPWCFPFYRGRNSAIALATINYENGVGIPAEPLIKTAKKESKCTILTLRYRYLRLCRVPWSVRSHVTVFIANTSDRPHSGVGSSLVMT